MQHLNFEEWFCKYYPDCDEYSPEVISSDNCLRCDGAGCRLCLRTGASFVFNKRKEYEAQIKKESGQVKDIGTINLPLFSCI